MVQPVLPSSWTKGAMGNLRWGSTHLNIWLCKWNFHEWKSQEPRITHAEWMFDESDGCVLVVHANTAMCLEANGRIPGIQVKCEALVGYIGDDFSILYSAVFSLLIPVVVEIIFKPCWNVISAFIGRFAGFQRNSWKFPYDSTLLSGKRIIPWLILSVLFIGAWVPCILIEARWGFASRSRQLKLENGEHRETSTIIEMYPKLSQIGSMDVHVWSLCCSKFWRFMTSGAIGLVLQDCPGLVAAVLLFAGMFLLKCLLVIRPWHSEDVGTSRWMNDNMQLSTSST